jgi:hypothetical protein
MTADGVVLAENSMRDTMMRFESLGDSCEFGIAQRHFKAEPLSLLRWASAPLNRVIALIEGQLDGFGHPDHVRIRLSKGEYMVDETRYHISYHAWVRDGEMALEALHEREFKRLHYLAGRLLDDLESAEKIFVVCRREIPLTQADVLPLHRGLRRFGPNTLLWVTLEDEQHAAGSVEPTADGLLHGYVDRFSDPERVPSTTSVDIWGRLCISTWRLCGDSLR